MPQTNIKKYRVGRAKLMNSFVADVNRGTDVKKAKVKLDKRMDALAWKFGQKHRMIHPNYRGKQPLGWGRKK